MQTTLPTWVPDIETKPAPMPLLVVQSFVNTWESDTGVDLLADPDERPAVAPRGRAVCAAADAVDLAEVRGFREASAACSSPTAVRGRWGPATWRAPRPLAAGPARSWRRSSTTARSTCGPGDDDGLAFLGGALLLIIRDAQRDGYAGPG